jgi:hypothetical protein
MDRAAPLIATAVGPSERVLAGARVESGISRWWILVSTYTLFFRKYYYLALTEHHVVLLKLSMWTGRPTKVDSVIPRNQVRVGDYRQGVVFGSFRFMIPGRSKPATIRVHRVFRPEIESVLGQLGVLAPAPGQAPGQAPAYGPGPNALPDGTVFGPPGGLPPGQQYPPQYAPPGGQDYGPPPGQQPGPPQYGPPPGRQYAPPPGQEYGPPPGQ